jgi:hypothetical protein
MNNSRRLCNVLLIQIALIPAFVMAASAQRGSASRPDPAATRGTINDDTMRELMNRERENAITARDNSEATLALLKQTREDFKTIQSINNKMMAEVFATQAIDYDRTSSAIAQINAKATRLKNNLSFLTPKDAKKNDLTVSGAKEFKSALLVMDRSLMSFVNNPIFQGKVIEVESVTRATQDLDNVITLSAKLKKIADNLKSSTPKR